MSGPKRIRQFLLTALAVVGLMVVAADLTDSGYLRLSVAQPAIAQTPSQSGRVRPQDVWRRVYERLPNLPPENQYVSIQTGQADPDNTLVSRLIRYHLYVKGRPPQYRLDWKLTLADYLGVNELMQESVYPGRDTLRTNPLEGDRAAINKLSRTQRDALVSTLASIFNPETANQANPAPTSQPRPQPTPTPRPTPNPNRPPQAQPGGAQLLLP